MEANQTIKSPKFTIENLAFPTALIGILVIATIIYWPGLSGTFLLDDVHTLRSLNISGGITDKTSLIQFIFGGSGVLGRPLSMLSFLIDDQYYPGDPAKYRYTNLMLHLLCGLLLLLFLLKVFDFINIDNNKKKYLALLVVSLWLLHPLNVSTTLYIVQRMTQVMALFVLAGMVSYAYGRELLATRQITGIALITAALIPLGLLAFLSKENGILICLYIVVLELTVMQHCHKPQWFKYWFGLLVLAPLFILTIYLSYKYVILQSGYSIRDFSLMERLLTEFRVLVTYLYQIIIPPSSGTGIFHDDIATSTSLLSPLTTIVSIIFFLTLIIAAFRFRYKQPVFSFAVLWFFGGHILESTIIPLELYFEHRNYLPMIGPLFGIIFYIYRLTLIIRKNHYKLLVQALPVFLIIMSSFLTFQSAYIWGQSDLRYSVWRQEHPNSLRAAAMLASQFEKRGKYAEAIELLEDTYRDHPETVALSLYILELSCQSGIPPKLGVKHIIAESSNAIFRNILPVVTKKLIETTVKSDCKFVNIDDLISILTSLENIQRLRGAAKAEVLFMLSDLYVHKRMLSPAIEALDRAYKAKRLPTIALRQAELLSSAGLFRDALGYIEIAKQADRSRKMLQPSEHEVINKMEANIIDLMSNNSISSQ